MKLKAMLIGIVALVAATVAQAQTTVVDITGATAFQTATLQAIYNIYNANGDFAYGHESGAGDFTSSKVTIFRGTWPGIAGTTIIRTSFNGSVEGINALVDSPASDPSYFVSTALDATALAAGGTEVPSFGAAKTTAESDMAFSDVRVTSTPFDPSSLAPPDAGVGVVAFTMIANSGAPAALTNITAKQFQALFQTGKQPLSLFTGNPADVGTTIYALGRNDGSGTRTNYLADTGVGITTLVNQYLVRTTNGAGGSIDTVILAKSTAQGGGSNASTIWGQDVPGNGGYNSGSTLRSTAIEKAMAASVTPYITIGGVEIAAGAATPAAFVSWLSAGDAFKAVQNTSNGARVLAYNGVTLSSIVAANSTLSAADVAKITNGIYTAWGYEQLYYKTSASTEVQAVWQDLFDELNNTTLNSTGTGVPVASMNVSRAVDGGVVTAN